MRRKWIWAMALVSLTAACVKPGSEDSDYAVQSRHGAWSVMCSEAQANCVAHLAVEEMTGEQVVQISGQLLPENEEAAAGIEFVIPARMTAQGRPNLTVNKAAGLVITVDHRLARQYPIAICEPDYCVVRARVTRGFLRALETGRTARLTLVYSGSEEKTEVLQVPLSGLAEAMKAAG